MRFDALIAAAVAVSTVLCFVSCHPVALSSAVLLLLFAALLAYNLVCAVGVGLCPLVCLSLVCCPCSLSLSFSFPFLSLLFCLFTSPFTFHCFTMSFFSSYCFPSALFAVYSFHCVSIFLSTDHWQQSNLSHKHTLALHPIPTILQNHLHFHNGRTCTVCLCADALPYCCSRCCTL